MLLRDVYSCDQDARGVPHICFRLVTSLYFLTPSDPVMTVGTIVDNVLHGGMTWCLLNVARMAHQENNQPSTGCLQL